MPLAPNTRFDHYEILAPLGKGGMGEVYRAKDTRLNREVAIKVLPGEVAHDAERLRRFEQEALATSSLNHPNILTVYDFGNYEGNPYLVMELLEGAELRAQLDNGAFPVRKAVEYAQQIAAGLTAAHEKGVVHRDLKPENLFVTKDNRVKILDFGLAKLRPPRNAPTGSEVATQKQYTSPGTVMGTVAYMSPEQVRGQDLEQRSDIFSFGLILYEMLAGQRAFDRQSLPEPTKKRLSGESPRWRGDGREWYFVVGNKLMAVSVTLGTEFQAGTPQPLFEIEGTNYAPSKDGQRFLVPVVTEKAPAPPINVVLNWTADLKK